MSTPLVSVLMPSYNASKYISIAIESVLQSTYKNFELIITDDNSTDGTYEIAKAYQEKDQRVKVYLNKVNLGDYPNRNRAASYANGEYIKYVDHDDYIYPHGLAQLIDYMEQFPNAGYGLCSLAQNEKRIYPFELSSLEAYKTNYFSFEIFHKAPLSSIIRKSAFDQVGGFTGKPLLGDFELWHLLSSKFPVVLMPQGIVWYRVHEAQESRKLDGNALKQFQYLIVGNQLIEAESCPLGFECKNNVRLQYKKRTARAIISAIKHHSFTVACKLKKHTNYSWFQILKNYK